MCVSKNDSAMQNSHNIKVKTYGENMVYGCNTQKDHWYKNWGRNLVKEIMWSYSCQKVKKYINTTINRVFNLKVAHRIVTAVSYGEVGERGLFWSHWKVGTLRVDFLHSPCVSYRWNHKQLQNYKFMLCSEFSLPYQSW